MGSQGEESQVGEGPPSCKSREGPLQWIFKVGEEGLTIEGDDQGPMQRE